MDKMIEERKMDGEYINEKIEKWDDREKGETER